MLIDFSLPTSEVPFSTLKEKMLSCMKQLPNRYGLVNHPVTLILHAFLSLIATVGQSENQKCDLHVWITGTDHTAYCIKHAVWPILDVQ